ncbi:hypothetical protein LO762_11460 [Actinocorallia sp. API 0066]|uniref:hypothetical protein n=1 Tax=Actinocorallia sp. API 0066 TaxID=2896846 RepID=UPI001E4C148F|nr:hypothetical protein [Actinocorallia sp. API 0066]MCD0449801.1 hypothetical protein [Actinocorallia sp. API 0066]
MAGAITVEQLRAEHPGWNIRRTGWAKATRTGRRLTTEELAAGLAETLIEDDLETLAAALADQAGREAGR